MLDAGGLNLSSAQNFLRLRAKKVFGHFVMEVGVDASEPKRFLPIVLACQDVQDFTHNRERPRAAFEVKGVNWIEIGALVGNRKDQPGFLPTIGLRTWIALAEMRRFGNVRGLCEIPALQNPLDRLCKHPGLDEFIRTQRNVGRESLQKRFPAILLLRLYEH